MRCRLLNSFKILLILSMIGTSIPAHASSPTYEKKLFELGQVFSEINKKQLVLNDLEYKKKDREWLEEDIKRILDPLMDKSFGLKEDLSGNVDYKRYQFLVSRFALDRALDSLQAWLLINPEKYLSAQKDSSDQSPLKDLLSKRVKLNHAVDPRWQSGKTSHYRPYSSFALHFPGLEKKIQNIERSIQASDPRASRQMIAESLILPSIKMNQIKEAMKRNDEKRMRLQEEVISPSENYEAAFEMHKLPVVRKFKEKIDELANLIGCEKYEVSRLQNDVPLEELTNGDLNTLEQKDMLSQVEQVLSGEACDGSLSERKAIKRRYEAFKNGEVGSRTEQRNFRVGLRYLKDHLIKEDIPAVNHFIFPLKREYEAVMIELDEANRESSALHTAYSQMLYQSPHFSILLQPVGEKDGEKILLYEKINEAATRSFSVDGIAEILEMLEKYLLELQDKMVNRSLRYIAYVASGDGKITAALVETRSLALSYIKEKELQQSEERQVSSFSWEYEKWKEQDSKLTGSYGFDIEHEKFAELTSYEIGQLLAISLASGQAKMVSPAAIKAISNFQDFKANQIKNIKNLESIKAKLFKEYQDARKAGKLDQKLQNDLNRKIANTDKLIKKNVRNRWFGLKLLKRAVPAWGLALALNGGFIAHNYWKNKNYRDLSRELILLGSSTGSLSYVANMHASSFDDKDLYYTAAIQAATAITFMHFTFLRGNNFAKHTNSLIRPKGDMNPSSFVHYIASSFGSATMNGARAIKKLPKTIPQKIRIARKKLKRELVREFDGDKSAHVSSIVGRSIGRPLYNTAGSVGVGLLVDMVLRGYLNPVKMLQEDKMALINVLSFSIIDFTLSYASEGRSVTKAGAINFIVGVLGIGLTQFIFEGEDLEEYDYQRLIFEGAFIATWSTMKYKLIFKRLFLKAETKYLVRNASAPRRVLGHSGLSAFNNFIGNAPFLAAVFHLEDYENMGEKEKYFAEKFQSYIATVEGGEEYLKIENLENLIRESQDINDELDERIRLLLEKDAA